MNSYYQEFHNKKESGECRQSIQENKPKAEMKETTMPYMTAQLVISE